MTLIVQCPCCRRDLEFVDAHDLDAPPWCRIALSGFAHKDGEVIDWCPSCEVDLCELVVTIIEDAAA